ncbi:MAG: MerR family transcriptional regulator [Spirochaetes bacterium]|nr:MerR family transcriptional regulator [Spirochaetota bacterium]
MATEFSGEKFPEYLSPERTEKQDKPSGLLSIGQIAKLCGVSTKTLRHYDKLGIFKPEYPDPETGYRFYKKEQLFWLVMIKRLKYRFFSLEEIAEFIGNTGIRDIEKMFMEKEAEIDKKIAELKTAKKLLNGKLAYFKQIGELEAEGLINMENFILKQLSSRQIIYIRKKELFSIETMSERLSMIQSIRENRNLDIKGLGMAIFHDDYADCCNVTDFEIASELESSAANDDRNIRTLPEGSYACFYHRGSRESSIEMYKKIMQQIAEKDLQTDGPLIKIYLLGFAHTKSRENIVSEFQIKVK